MPIENPRATVVAVAGSAGLDVTLRDPPRHWIGEVPRDVYTHPTLLRLTSPAEMGLGGNGGSASYVLGKSGLKVHLNAPIGHDPAGQLVRGWLAQAGVECVATAGHSTMQAITAVDEKGRRLGTIQHVGPALDWSLSSQDGEAAWLLVSLPGQVPVEVMPEILKLLKSFGRADRVRVLDTGVGWTGKVDPEQVRELWIQAEVVVGILEELSTWTSGRTSQAVAELVLAAGPQTVVIKMGSAGAAYQSKQEAFARQAPVRVRRIDVSIGAGDAFNGALIGSLIQGQSLADSVAKAQRVAATVVERGRGVLGWSETLANSVSYFC